MFWLGLAAGIVLTVVVIAITLALTLIKVEGRGFNKS